jgi:nicotinamide-nucleotide amidase
MSSTDAASAVIRDLLAAGQTVGTAESLTGGLVCAALTAVPGASAVVRGGVVSYATGVKSGLLAVPTELLDRVGAVSPETALAMADEARTALASDWAVATTGVAGPDPVEGKPVGTVYVAVSGPGPAGESRHRCRALTLVGSREQIRDQTVREALDLLQDTMRCIPAAIVGPAGYGRGTRSNVGRAKEGFGDGSAST